MCQNASKILPKTFQDPSKFHQLRPKMLPRPPKFSSRRPSSRHYGPSGAQLGSNFAHLVPNFVENSDRIAPNMPGRTRRPLQITIFLDFGPLQATIFNDFGYILQVFQALFCTLRPTSDLFFRRLWTTIFIQLGTVPCIFPICFVHVLHALHYFV